MSYVFHWGDQLNWMPLVFLLIVSIMVLLMRMLTVWFYTRKPMVPTIISNFYFLSGCGLIIVTIWGLINTAWWMLPLGILSWYLAHSPFRKEMESWAQDKKLSMDQEDNKNTSNFRPKVGLEWEDVQHVEDGGSKQLAKIQDGTFIFLSVGLLTAKVFTALKRQSISDFHEVKSFMILERESLSRFSEQELQELAQGLNKGLNKQLHKENEVILEHMRALIKSPRTVQELADTLMSSNCPVSI